MHLDDGEVDLTSHIHVPAVGVQTHVSSDVLSYYKGHAAAFSSQRFSIIGKNELHWRIWKSGVSWVLGSTDVVWATSWLGWVAISGCSANEVAVGREWYSRPSRTESHKDQ